jgi:hypothetical protein
MTTDDRAGLMLGGRHVDPDEVWARVLRYCGLPWDDHPAETWAFRYFDAIETDPTSVSPQDVVSAGALHSGLSRDDLAWFWDHRAELDDWLGSFPVDEQLRTADEATIAQLAELPMLFPGPSLSLLTKVLHRKRPWLIPMVDREIIDWYRPLTGQRRAVEAWAPLLPLLAEDLEVNRDQLVEPRVVLLILHNLLVTDLRMVDIVIWMGGQR